MISIASPIQRRNNHKKPLAYQLHVHTTHIHKYQHTYIRIRPIRNKNACVCTQNTHNTFSNQMTAGTGSMQRYEYNTERNSIRAMFLYTILYLGLSNSIPSMYRKYPIAGSSIVHSLVINFVTEARVEISISIPYVRFIRIFSLQFT